MTKKPFYLTATVPPGPRQAPEAEKLKTRFLNQVDEGRNPKTRTKVGQLIVKYFEVVDVDVLTLRGYRSKYKNHIKPLLDATPLSKLGQIGTGVKILDSFYADLRRCRLHCDGKTFIEHRTAVPHQRDEHEGNRCPRNNPQECRRCRRMCKPHVCKGLGASTIRQIHGILSGALGRAVEPRPCAWPPGTASPPARPTARWNCWWRQVCHRVPREACDGCYRRRSAFGLRHRIQAGSTVIAATWARRSTGRGSTNGAQSRTDDLLITRRTFVVVSALYQRFWSHARPQRVPGSP